MLVNFLIIILNLLSLFSFIYIITVIVMYKLKPEYNLKEIKAKIPFVSVIICALNEEETIEETLRKLISVDYPKDKMEIIVVSDSTDRTNQICNKYKKYVKLISRSERKGKWSALNEGIEKSKGEIIITIDADTIVSKKWLRNIVMPFQSEDIQLVFGPRFAKHPEYNFITKAQSFYVELSNAIMKILHHLNMIYSSSGDNMAFRKNVWNKCKFRDVIDEDVDFCFRLFNNGFRGYFVENADVKVRIPVNFSDLKYQQIRWMQVFLQFKLFSFLILFVFVFFFPLLSIITIVCLTLTSNALVSTLLIINISLFAFLYILFCLRTRSKSFSNSLYLLILNPVYFLFLVENFIENILKIKIKWIEYKY